MSRILILMALFAAQESSASRTPAWVETRISEIQPTAAERKFDQIAWVSSIQDALRLARESGRPILMFTYDGQMQTGRC